MSNWYKISQVNIDQIEHLIGNPLFAIETNLDPLAKRIRENRIDEALQIVEEIRQSVITAKAALDTIRNIP